MSPGNGTAPQGTPEGPNADELAGAIDSTNGSNPNVDPVVVAVTVHGTRRTRDITVHCPHCERLHTHGWPHGDTEPGHRVAHCLRVRDTGTGKWRDRKPSDRVGGYVITVGPSTTRTGLQAVTA